MFYIIERQDQLDRLNSFEDCYVDFIQYNDNFHPQLSPLSLIYIRDLTKHKGYILCLNHNESLSLNKDIVFEWLNKNTQRLFVLDKKHALYHYPYADKLYDVNFIEQINVPTNNCFAFYYRKHRNLHNVNTLIPVSKHYEKNENFFNVILPVISKYAQDNALYAFNNGILTRAFYEIESQGINVDKKCFITHYGEHLDNPEFSLSKGKIYSHYNLYTTTGRPSNTFNTINFAALNKTNGERACYKPSNDKFIEFDIQGYHPRLIGELVDFYFPKHTNTYETLGELLNVSAKEAKELTFKQLYGGIWKEYQDKPFFKDVAYYVSENWKVYEDEGKITCVNRAFRNSELDDMNPQKLFNYVIQSYETSQNVEILERIFNYLKGKKTKLVLYTYDAFLFDYAAEDGDIISDIEKLIWYSVTVKQGNTYHGLEKI